jgi:MSHA pilin protein MshD
MRSSFRSGVGGNPLRPAFTLTEAVVSIAIVGVMLVAALNTVGASQTTRKTMGDRSRGMLLAEDLMSEILQQHYEDPDYALGSFGLAAAEVGDGSRALWEDVDDYDGWSASPPQAKDGTELTGFDGWTRAVSVSWVTRADPAVVSASDTGVKVVVVTVSCDGQEVATLTALRTRAWQYVPEDS